MSTCSRATIEPAGGGPAARLGERLADWLDGLGLAEQLAAAGLPTYDRAHGSVRWREPGTLEPLSADRLADLDRQLRGQGEDPAYGVPLGLVRLRRESRVRAELLDGGWLDYAGLAALRGVSENAARFAVHKAAPTYGVLVVPHREPTLIPRFQFDEQGEVRAEVRPLLATLLGAGMDPWPVWIWLTTPAGLLSGAVPHEAARDDDERPLVERAARALAGRVAATRA